MRTLFKTLTAALLFIGLMPPAQAGMIATPDASRLPAAGMQNAREALVRQLTDLGVEAAEARARVAGLDDAQIAELNRRIADLPAGADAAGILLTVFIVFVITDVIGATDIFPFIHPVNTK